MLIITQNNFLRHKRYSVYIELFLKYRKRNGFFVFFLDLSIFASALRLISNIYIFFSYNTNYGFKPAE